MLEEALHTDRERQKFSLLEKLGEKKKLINNDLRDQQQASKF